MLEKVFTEQMFGAFPHCGKARKTDDGTGLGLAISRIIIEKHGGALRYFYRDNENVSRSVIAKSEI